MQQDMLLLARTSFFCILWRYEIHFLLLSFCRLLFCLFVPFIYQPVTSG